MNSGSGGVRDAHSPLVSYVRFPGEAEAERSGEMPQHATTFLAAPSGGGGGGSRWLVVGLLANMNSGLRWLVVLDGRREAAPRSLATFSCEKRLILSRTRPLRG